MYHESDVLEMIKISNADAKSDYEFIGNFNLNIFNNEGKLLEKDNNYISLDFILHI